MPRTPRPPPCRPSRSSVRQRERRTSSSFCWTTSVRRQQRLWRSVQHPHRGTPHGQSCTNAAVSTPQRFTASRQALLTGGNSRSVGMGGITEIASGSPGYSSVLPNTAAPLAKILKLNGYATAQFGKCQRRMPVWETSPVRTPLITGPPAEAALTFLWFHRWRNKPVASPATTMKARSP